MLSKDFWIWSESFERGWVKRKSLIWGAVLQLGAKGRTKSAGTMGKGVKGEVHDGLSVLDRLPQLCAPACSALSAAERSRSTVGLEPKDQFISRMALYSSIVSHLIFGSQKETHSAVYSWWG